MPRSLLLPALVLLLAGCAGSGTVTTTVPETVPEGVPDAPRVRPVDSLFVLSDIPAAPREFRAAWIASVANIDWPTEPGLPPERQRDELRALLDQAVSLGLNAVILQVRPAADALYASDLEPWSYYLSGMQGVAPEPFYDPLTFAVEAAHRRGLELHAWFNPYRAGHPTQESGFDSLHVSLQHPERVKQYGELKWMDPGLPEVRAHSLAVIADVVRRYDVDGVHVDDYFYPYAISDSTGAEVAFPDSTSWQAALDQGWEGSLGDWRRANVDAFVEAMYDSVKAIKPHVKVGISPFGIWRPGYPEGIEGFDAYEGLYGDSRLWINEGWVDYYTPQLYWALESSGQPYGPLLDWWISENTQGRHIWPGNYASRVILEGRAQWQPDELVRQVQATRERAGATGNVHFSMKALLDGPGADQALADSVYREPALIPATPWLADSTAVPARPMAAARTLGRHTVLDLTPGGGAAPFVWHVRERRADGWSVRVVPGWQRQLRWASDWPNLVVVSAVDRLGMEGPAVILGPIPIP